MRVNQLPGSREAAAMPGTAELPPSVTELDSEAPIVGSVHPVPVARLGVAAVHRPPAVAVDSVRVGDLHVAGASLIGLSHLVSGGARQDAYSFVATADGSLVVAIADGLGSRPLSQVGASFFCTGVMQAAVSRPESAAALLLAGASHAATAAENLYHLKASDISFVAAVAVIMAPVPDGARRAEIARVGDVSAFALGEGELVELFAADDEPVNVVRSALPGTAEPEVIHSTAGMIALATDGLAVDLRTSPGIQRWLSGRWAAPLGPFAFADTLRYQRQGSHDDRTAVAFWQLGAKQSASDHGSDITAHDQIGEDENGSQNHEVNSGVCGLGRPEPSAARDPTAADGGPSDPAGD
jgi:Protein phosphatase 2C